MSTKIKYKDETLVSFNKGTVILRADNHSFLGDVEIISEGGESVPKWNEDYTASDDVEEIIGEESPLPIEIGTEAEMTALLSTAEVGSVYKYIGETTDTYKYGALYVVEVSE